MRLWRPSVGSSSPASGANMAGMDWRLISRSGQFWAESSASSLRNAVTAIPVTAFTQILQDGDACVPELALRNIQSYSLLSSSIFRRQAGRLYHDSGFFDRRGNQIGVD